MSFYIDLSEFFVNPIKTGIQRISGEICRYMPRGTAVPVRIREERYVALAPELIQVIGRYFEDTSGAALADIRRLSAVKNGSVIELSSEDTMLVPEVFDNAQRLAFFRAMTDEQLRCCRFIVYDLLPVTHPHYFKAPDLANAYVYFHLLRRVQHCGFISDFTRDTYYKRFKRADSTNGVVLPLGSDALGPPAERLILNRPPIFNVIGTIEPRKNHALILEAFEPLLRTIGGLTLYFIGSMGWVDPAFASKVESMCADPDSGLRFIPAPSDVEVRRHIEQSRATIYVSAAEGFGLPPVESLWIGTPVIASTMIPSLHRLGSHGIRYVDPLTVFNLRRAILDFLDDEYANRKTAEISNLCLPTWYSFTQQVLEWCTPATGIGMS